MPASRIEALRLLGRRDYTIAELERRLLERGFAPDDVEQTIGALSAEGLLDDRRVAAGHIRTASAVKHRGRKRIRLELEARGVDAALVQELLAEMPPEAELAAIETVLRRRPAPTTPQERDKLFQRLLRRGFAADLVARALKASDD